MDWFFDEALFRRMETLRLNARASFMGLGFGDRLSHRKGESLEFYDFRPYAAGDDLRYVDWNVYARLDRLVVKLFFEERDLCLHLLLDTSGSMANKLNYAFQAIAALAYINLNNNGQVALGLFDKRCYRILPPRRGRKRLIPLMKMLTRVRAKGETGIDSALTQYALQTRTPGVIILISDLLEAESSYQTGVKSLLQNGFEVHLIHLLAPEEEEPALSGEFRLVDCEDNSERELTIDGLAIAHYKQNFERFCAEVRAFCHRCGVGYVRLTTDVPIEDLIFKQLRRSHCLK